MKESIVRLTPISTTNLPKAFWISWESFKGEWPLVWLTYLWHFARVHGLGSVIPMIRCHYFRLELGERIVGKINILSTPIHESDTPWVILDLQEPVQGGALAEFLMHLMRKCRLAVLQTSGRVQCLEEAGPIEYEGSMPGTEQGDIAIYSVRRDRVPRTASNGFSAVSLECRRPEVHTEFHLIQRGRSTVGITGLYVVETWPHIGWGGWGTIRRRFAQRHTVLDTLAATENLARRRGQEWFCIMTSSSPQYRSACRMYEHYGMTRLLSVDDFFHSGRGSQDRDSYLVFGKRLNQDDRP